MIRMEYSHFKEGGRLQLDHTADSRCCLLLPFSSSLQLRLEHLWPVISLDELIVLSIPLSQLPFLKRLFEDVRR